MLLSNVIDSKECSGGWCVIFIAGDVPTIRHACRAFCLEGLCVSFVRTDFIFTGGMESGVAVVLINYARFPKEQQELEETAVRLADHLIIEAVQQSATVLTPGRSIWRSRRRED